MSFLTALLGGLGGYMQGRQQRQDYNLQQQQYTQAEADRQRALQIDENKYRDTAAQVLANRGTDPTTARWNPQTMQYEGGTAFPMPKGWEVTPKDPAQAMSHFARLQSIYLGQNRPDLADSAGKMYESAAAQVKQANEFQQQIGLEKMRLQGTMYEEYVRQKFQGNEDQLNRDQTLAIHNDDVNVRWALHNSPTAAEIYGTMTKTPESAVKAFTTNLAQYHAQMQTIVGNLNSTNSAAAAKQKQLTYQTLSPDQYPNPNMTGYATRLGKQVDQIEQHPERLPQAISMITLYNGLYKGDPKALQQYVTMYKKQPDPSFFMSDDQASKAITLLQNVAHAASGRKSAQNIIDTVNSALTSGAGYGGSNAPSNPRYPHP